MCRKMAANVQELMAKVARLRVLTTRLIDDELSGDYHSTFRGQGVEFEEVRPYTPGDDIRSIDWNVTARMGSPYVKRYAEERELTVLFVVDVSASQNYGRQGRTKAEVAAEVTALLALTALKNQDKVGLLLFSDKILSYLPPRKGRDSVLRLVREVLAAGESAEGTTDMEGALSFLNSVRKRRAVVFLVSDFLNCAGIDKTLRITARRHDLVCVTVEDPSENQLPAAGLLELEDPETGEFIVVDTSDVRVQKAFAENAMRERAALTNLFTKTGIDRLELSTDRPIIDAVRALFKKRAKKGRRS